MCTEYRAEVGGTFDRNHSFHNRQNLQNESMLQLLILLSACVSATSAVSPSENQTQCDWTELQENYEEHDTKQRTIIADITSLEVDYKLNVNDAKDDMDILEMDLERVERDYAVRREKRDAVGMDIEKLEADVDVYIQDLQEDMRKCNTQLDANYVHLSNIFEELTRIKSEVLELKAQKEENVEGGNAADCKDILQKNPRAPSGVYTIYLGIKQQATRVYCDMDTWYGGWTSIMRRFNGSVKFNLTWSEMMQQVGDLEGEHWLGLEVIHLMTSATPLLGGCYSLLVELEGHSETAFAFYSDFWIDSEFRKYRLHIGGYNSHSSAGDSLMSLHNDINFSTYDKDNDNKIYQNCAQSLRGPWWYDDCHRANLLAPYMYTESNQGIVNNTEPYMGWREWNRGRRSTVLKSASMKVRRMD